MPKLSREFCGKVEIIDHSAGRIVVTDGKRSIELSLTERTRFVRGVRFESLKTLEANLPVCVRYRSPVFGKHFATRVISGERKHK